MTDLIPRAALADIAAGRTNVNTLLLTVQPGRRV